MASYVVGCYVAALFCCLSLATSRAEVYGEAGPVLKTAPRLKMKFDGPLGARLHANLENWELRVPDANPALTEMFNDRDRKPGRNLLPWSGEFVGKYLCASILSYRILRDPRQKAMIDRVAHALLTSQASDGYLGPFDRQNRLTGKNWDLWGHYWAIRGLLLYYEEFGSREALDASTRAADLIVRTFLDKGIPLTNDESFGQMNYAIIHAFTKLYRITGKSEYLDMARWIVNQWDQPGAGLYMKMALAGRDMFEFPGNRWESVHDFQGMLDMYFLTGEDRYQKAFSQIWYSILKGDRHNTGGFTSGEHTTGNPYDRGAIETCCTVAWTDMSIDMLKLTANSLVADELELSLWNGLLGGQNPAGNWWTYNTPMDGTKEAAVQTINFQCRPGSPDLNCCSVNGPRGMALVSEWAVLTSPGSVTLNFYGPSVFEFDTPGGQRMTIEQKTSYPVGGDIALHMDLSKPEKIALRLRIPAWSTSTQVLVTGKPAGITNPGTYLNLEREWRGGDEVRISLDMSAHYWAGEREEDGRTAVYRGPLLLAFDPVYNVTDPEDIPQMDAVGLRLDLDSTDRLIKPWVLLRVKALDGRPVVLCDFATAGAYGNHYVTWLPILHVAPRPFDRSHPAWNSRPGY